MPSPWSVKAPTNKKKKRIRKLRPELTMDDPWQTPWSVASPASAVKGFQGLFDPLFLSLFLKLNSLSLSLNTPFSL